MGQTGGKTNSRSGSLTAGLKKKNLKLTVIFAPVNRCELLDIYNPIEFPCVDREMRVISRQVDSSGDYVAEDQDKVIYINCSTIEVQTACVSEGSLPMLVSINSSSLMDKLQRAIQLIHELLDYWHGYGGTVFTTFCCYQPLEDLMVALQSILGCPGSNSAQDAEFFSDASSSFSDAFDFYYEWTFVNKHSSVYKAEYKYESYNGKSEEENLKNANEDMMTNLNLSSNLKDKEAFQKFRQYQDMSNGVYKTQYRLELEGFVKSHPEYQQHLKLLDNNNRRLEQIEKENQKLAEEWSEKSHGQRLGAAKSQIDKYYDAQIKAAEAEEKRDKRYLDEIAEKRKQLDWQQGKKSQFTSDSVTQRYYDAYNLGVELHGAYHDSNEIEDNGEYYNKDQIDQMFWAMKGRLGSKKRALQAKKEQAWRKAQEDIRKQIYVETVNAGLQIFSIVAIVLTPLSIVSIIVGIGKMFTVEGYAKDWRNWVSLGLDLFALVPFVGAATKGTKGASAIVINDLSGQGETVIKGAVKTEAQLSEGIIKNIDNLGLAGTEIDTLNKAITSETVIGNRLKAQSETLLKDSSEAMDLASANYKAGNQAIGNIYEKASNNLYKQSIDFAEKANSHLAQAGMAESRLSVLLTDNVLARNQLITGNMSSIGGGAREVIETLPVISLGGYVKDINLYIKNFSNMSWKGRAAAGGDIVVQTIGHGGNIYGGYGNLSSLATGPTYSVQSNGDDFVIVAKK